MCIPGVHKPELWLWNLQVAAFRTTVQLVENHGNILVWLEAFFTSSRSLSAKEKKPNTVRIFEAQVHFLLLQSWNRIIWFCPRDLVCSMTGDWRSWKMLSRLISNMWLWLSRSLSEAKELFLLNTFSSIRAGPSLYAVESLVSLQTLSNPSFAFAKRLPKFLACNE